MMLFNINTRTHILFLLFDFIFLYRGSKSQKGNLKGIYEIASFRRFIAGSFGLSQSGNDEMKMTTTTTAATLGRVKSKKTQIR